MSKRFKKDRSVDGCPIRDNESKLLLSTEDVLILLNHFDDMKNNINKIKADAVREARNYAQEKQGFHDDSTSLQYNEKINEYIKILEKGK